MKNLSKIAIICLFALGTTSTFAQVGIGTTSPVSTLDVRGSVSFSNRTISGSCTLNTTDQTVVFTGTTAATITLPSATTCAGREVYIKNYSSNNSAITVAASLSQTIDGNSTFAIRNQYEVILFMSDGTNWIVKDQSAPSTAGSAWYLKGNTGTTAGTHFIGTNDAVDFVTKTNGTEVMRASSAGNVGIGTTSPGSKLDVKGTFRLSGSTSGYVGFAPAAAAGSTTYTLPAADGTSGYQLTTNGSGTLSWVAAGGTTTNTLSSATNTLTSTVNGVVATASAVNSVANTSSTNSLSTTVNGISSSAVNIINSNALTAASSALTSTVNGVTSTLTPAAGTIGASTYLGFDASGNLVKGATPTASTTNTLGSSVNTLTSTVNGVVATASAVNTVANTSSANNLTTTVNGVAATAVPMVNSISNTSSTNSLSTTVNGVAGTAVNIINSNATSLSGTNLTTTVNGVAATALDLSPAITSKAWSLTGNSGTSYATNFLGTTDNKSLRFRTNNAARMIIDSTGNIGIGTITPGTSLDVKGTMRLSGSTSGYVGFAPAAAAGSTTYTLPSADGTSGYQLTTNGSGTLSWAAPFTISGLSNTSSANTLSTTLNGTTGATVPIINSNALTAASSALTSTVNGVASTLTPSAGTIGASTYLGFDASGNLVKGATPTVSTTNTLALSTNTLTSTVNGVAATASAVGSVSNTSSTNSLSTTVNGVAGTAVNIINSNATSLSGTNLTTTVNGVAATALDLSPAITSKAWSLTGNSGTSYSTNFLGTTDNKSLRFRTNNAARMIIDSVGFVGIGTISPASALEVNGTMRLDGSTSGYVALKGAATAGSTTYTLPSADGTSGQQLTTNGAGVLTWTNQTGATSVSNTSSANTLSTTVNGTTGSTVNIINTNALNSTTNTLTSTVNGVAATGVNIINSNTLGLSGNTLTSTVNGVAATSSAVGTVSNTSSANTLSTTVNGVAGSSVNIINTNALTAASSALTSTVNGVASTLTPSAGTVAASSYLGFDASGNLVKGSASSTAWNLTGNAGTTAGTNFVGTTDAIDFVTKTNNTEKMRITSAGKIGIGGVTAPTYDVSLIGTAAKTIAMERTTTAASAGNALTVQSGGAISGTSNLAGGDITLSSGISTGTGTSNLYIKTATAGSSGTTDNTPSTKMTVLGSGNVGVGTTTPGALVETMNGNVLINNNNNTSGELRIAEPSTGGSSYTSFKAGAQSANITYTLPSTVGAANAILMNDGSGNLSWTSQGSTVFTRKTSDQSVTNSTTLVNDNALQLTIGANEIWEVEFELYVSASDMRFAVTMPTGGTMLLDAHGDDGSDSNDDELQMTTPGTAYQFNTSNFDYSSSGILNWVRVKGLVVNSSTAGTVHLQFAQGTSNATATTVKTNSYFKATRMQ